MFSRFTNAITSFFQGPQEPEEVVVQQRGYSISQPLPFLLGLTPPGSTPVNEDVVLANSAAFTAIRYISEGIAMLDREILDRDGKRSLTHDLVPLINGRPHPNYSWFDMTAALVANACLGNGYLLIHRDPMTMRPWALEHIPAQMCWPDYGVNGGLIYRIGGVLNGRVISLVAPCDDVIHIKGVTLNGIAGPDMVLTHRGTFAAAAAAAGYTEGVFANRATPSIAVRYNQPLDSEERANLEQNIRNRHSGAVNAGMPFVLDDGMEIQYLQWNPNDVAMVDFKDLSVRDIARLFKLPADFMVLDQKGTYGATKQKSQDFLTHTLGPWKEKIEEEMNAKLFYLREFQRRTYRFAYNVGKFTELDRETQASVDKVEAERVARLVASSIITPNEGRLQLGLPLSADPNADKLYGDINTLPLDALVQVALAKYLSSEGEKKQGEDQQQNSTDDEQQSTAAAAE
jgi:HK97 family phage portal protein